MSIKLLSLTVAATLFAGPAAWAAAPPAPASAVSPVASELLPNAPGKRLSASLVSYPPGGKSGAHTHGGAVFAYVLSGSIRSALDNGEVKIYKAGESFFERPGQTTGSARTPAPPNPPASWPSSSPTTASC